MRDVIIGIHSIVEALKNPVRTEKQLMGSDEAINELKKELPFNLDREEKIEVVKLSPHAVQEEAKRAYKERGFQYQRVASNIFLLAGPLEEHDLADVYDKLEKGELARLLALDGVSDARNGAAILRTAAFYGVEGVIVAGKGNFGQSPAFFRISSGAREHVSFIRVSSLPKCLKKLAERGVQCCGLSERGEVSAWKNLAKDKPLCLVLGAEDTGLSHAVERSLSPVMKLAPQGPIESLNVSVAGAIALEKTFGF